MNILDIIYTIIAGFLAVRGFLRGLLLEAASLAGAVAGVFFANAHSRELLPYVSRVITNPGLAGMASYLAVFVATMIVATLLASLVKRIMSLTFTAWIDHLAGVLLGLAEAALVCSVILLAMTHFFPGSALVSGSTAAPYLKEAIVFGQQLLTGAITL